MNPPSKRAPNRESSRGMARAPQPLSERAEDPLDQAGAPESWTELPEPPESWGPARRLARREAVSPLDRLQHALHGWVAFGIMPLFAFANAGVPLGSAILVGSALSGVAACAVGRVVLK